jgi:hypothetical protein
VCGRTAKCGSSAELNQWLQTASPEEIEQWHQAMAYERELADNKGARMRLLAGIFQ